MNRSNRNRKTAGVRLVPQGEFIRYRVLRYHSCGTISIERFTGESPDFYVRANGSRVIKDGVDYIYFATWEEARNHSLSMAKHELRNARNQVAALEAMTCRTGPPCE